MNKENLYCKNCKKNYNVRNEDIDLMKKHDPKFNGEEYTKGCFFKDLAKIKRAGNLKNNR